MTPVFFVKMRVEEALAPTSKKPCPSQMIMILNTANPNDFAKITPPEPRIIQQYETIITIL